MMGKKKDAILFLSSSRRGFISLPLLLIVKGRDRISFKEFLNICEKFDKSPQRRRRKCSMSSWGTIVMAQNKIRGVRARYKCYLYSTIKNTLKGLLACN
jgi:hypothetical protein